MVTIEGVPYLDITPEAGSVKTNTARTVPIHPHLIDQGFFAFVDAKRPGPLFYCPGKRTSDGPWDRTSKALGDWVSSPDVGVTNMRIQPNHGWHHRFKDLADRVGIEERYSDQICGYSPKTVSRGYRTPAVDTLLREISRVPRLDV